MAHTKSIRSASDRMQCVQWDAASPLAISVETPKGELVVRHGRFVGGRCDGVEIVQVDTGSVVANVLPTRGMSIWSLECPATRFGWNSPVDGPVHPALVPLFDPGGLGWLEGFDELLVRCGLESNGAPELDDNGRLLYPLHGRIGNLPADGLELDYDEVSGRLELIGEVVESRLFFTNFRIRSRLRFTAGSSRVEILDDVHNQKSTPATMQLLYHINVGAPVLEDGSKLIAPIDELAPKDSLSASEIEQWNAFGAPENGYSERVYFSKLRADEAGITTVMLQSAAADKALAVNFDTKTLPRFVLWKNTAAESDGYVTGLEPATNYPNTRSYEASQDRVVELEPDQVASFRVTLQPLVDAKEIADVAERIEKLGGDEAPKIHQGPRPGWTPGA